MTKWGSGGECGALYGERSRGHAVSQDATFGVEVAEPSLFLTVGLHLRIQIFLNTSVDDVSRRFAVEHPKARSSKASALILRWSMKKGLLTALIAVRRSTTEMLTWRSTRIRVCP